MRKFAIEVHGQGFPIAGEDGTIMDGFVVTVFNEAEDEIDACENALRTLVESEDFQAKIGRHADPDHAKVFVEQWFELASFDGCVLPNSGYIFYQSKINLN